MRNLFILGALLVAAFMAGWFTIDRDGEQTTIKINREEIRQDARQAIDRGKDYLDRKNLGPDQDSGVANTAFNVFDQATSELRYTQQGGQYGAPAGYQPQQNPGPNTGNPPSQLQYVYPENQQPAAPGTAGRFPPARY